MISVMETYFLWFMIYSFIGWLYESIVCSISAKRIINRGFLNGPYCPIYGFGALINILVLNPKENILVIFILGLLLNSILEYFTSYLMEKLFHARWWDYSKRKFNINGRVYLLGALTFGALSVLVVKFVHPFILSYSNKVLTPRIHLTTIIILVIFISDIIISLKGIVDYNKLLNELEKVLEKTNFNIQKQIKNSTFIEKGKSIFTKINRQHYRMITAFPNFKSLKYNNILLKIKNNILNKKK